MIRQGIRKRIFSAVAVMALASLFSITPFQGSGREVEAAGGVKINSTNFPDSGFRNYILEWFDENDNKILESSEIENIEELYITEDDVTIKSIKGIECFTQLKYFNFEQPELAAADFGASTKIEEITIYSTALKSIKVSGCKNLKSLYISGGKLTSIDLSGNTKLDYLGLSEIPLSGLDISKNTKLTKLDVDTTNIAKIDLSKNTLLKEAYLYDNKITSLNVNGLKVLTSLDCRGNKIKSLDVSKCNKLEILYCESANDSLTSLKVSGASLKQLSCSSKNLKYVNIVNCKSLINVLKKSKAYGEGQESYVWADTTDPENFFEEGRTAFEANKNTVIVYSTDTFQKQGDGSWAYIVNGEFKGATDVVKGTVNKETAWWYVENGKVKKVNTVAKNSGGWWCIQNGKVNFSFTGFAKNSSGWWYCKNGQVDFSKTDVLKGTVNGKAGWWFVKKGQVQFVDSVEKNSSGWWCIQNGQVNFNFNGIAKNANGYWYCEKGQVKFIDTVAQNASGWWAIRNGKVDFSFNGIAKNANGSWYCKGGKVQFGFTGKVTYNGKTYNVKNGKVQ